MKLQLIILHLLSIHKVLAYDGGNDQGEHNNTSTSIQIYDRIQRARRDEEDNSNELDGGRIVGGSKVPKGTYPWHARAVDENRDFDSCGGTLVASDFILTAAQCPTPDGYEIGSLCHKKKGNCGQRQEYRRVKKVFVHPKYENRSGGVRFDFKLIKLEKASTIQPATLDITDWKLSTRYTTGKELWAVGYGLMDFDDKNALPGHLQHVQVNYWTNEDCDNSFTNINRKIDYTMMCALGNSTPRTDACDGDSGSALYDKEKDKVVGMTSWGQGCATEYPGVYSRITVAQWWIKDKLCRHSRDKKKFYFCKNESKQKGKG